MTDLGNFSMGWGQFGGSNLDATAFAVLAMAQHRLGRREQAFAALDKAEAIVPKKMAAPGSRRPFGSDWDDWLRCRILLDEPRKLMKKDSQGPRIRSRATNRTDS